MGIKLSFKFVAAARGRWRMHTRCIVNIGVRGAGDTRGRDSPAQKSARAAPKCSTSRSLIEGYQ